jgi:hypothetical protein
MLPRRSLVAFAIAFGLARSAWSEGEATDNAAAVSSALEQTPGPKQEKAGAALEILPPAPRKKGLVLETHLGAIGFLGKLRTVSPTASRLNVQLGYELLRWLMVFGEGDVAFTSTRYSPPSRGYGFYGFGAGARLTAGIGERVSLYGQGDIGMMQTTTDVLHTYGFYDAENLNIYWGGSIGLEWYQVNPHYALALNGGARKSKGFERALASDPAMAWLAAAAIRYAF